MTGKECVGIVALGRLAPCLTPRSAARAHRGNCSTARRMTSRPTCRMCSRGLTVEQRPSAPSPIQALTAAKWCVLLVGLGFTRSKVTQVAPRQDSLRVTSLE